MHISNDNGHYFNRFIINLFYIILDEYLTVNVDIYNIHINKSTYFSFKINY